MASATRKIRRKQDIAFKKEFNKSMKKFKKMVRCSQCFREPIRGEKIDDWHIDKYSEKIDLVCDQCYEGEKK